MMLLGRSVVAVGVLLVAGCGGSQSSSESSTEFTEGNITQRVTAAMVAQGSMHVEMTVTAGPDVFVASGDQELDKDYDDTAMSIVFSNTGEDDTSFRLVDGIIFANLGETSGDKFVRIDPNDTSSQMGRAFAPLIDDLDIAKSVGQFGDAITDVEQVGDKKTIDGVETTPYHVTIDVGRAIASGALDKDSNLNPAASVEYTFYIDADDLLRRMEFSIDEARGRVDVTDYGKPVEIVAPAAAEVVDESVLSSAVA